MKTRNLLITLGVAAIATMNVMAGELALSPRATGNQIKVAPGANTDPNLTSVAPRSASPRFAENQIKTVTGKDTSVNPSMACTRHMNGTPKAVAACAEHPGADMPCCSVAVSK